MKSFLSCQTSKKNSISYFKIKRYYDWSKRRRDLYYVAFIIIIIYLFYFFLRGGADFFLLYIVGGEIRTVTIFFVQNVIPPLKIPSYVSEAYGCAPSFPAKSVSLYIINS